MVAIVTVLIVILLEYACRRVLSGLHASQVLG